MEFILICIIAATFGYLAYRYFKSNALVSSDDKFSQNGVTVDYNKQTITIKNKTFSVEKVTGIGIRTNGNATFLQIKIDDRAGGLGLV